jgi:hypothetical protein
MRTSQRTCEGRRENIRRKSNFTICNIALHQIFSKRSRRIAWGGDVGKIYNILARKPEEKKVFGRFICK